MKYCNIHISYTGGTSRNLLFWKRNSPEYQTAAVLKKLKSLLLHICKKKKINITPTSVERNQNEFELQSKSVSEDR